MSDRNRLRSEYEADDVNATNELEGVDFGGHLAAAIVDNGTVLVIGELGEVTLPAHEDEHRFSNSSPVTATEPNFRPVNYRADRGRPVGDGDPQSEPPKDHDPDDTPDVFLGFDDFKAMMRHKVQGGGGGGGSNGGGKAKPLKPGKIVPPAPADEPETSEMRVRGNTYGEVEFYRMQHWSVATAVLVRCARSLRDGVYPSQPPMDVKSDADNRIGVRKLELWHTDMLRNYPGSARLALAKYARETSPRFVERWDRIGKDTKAKPIQAQSTGSAVQV